MSEKWQPSPSFRAEFNRHPDIAPRRLKEAREWRKARKNNRPLAMLLYRRIREAQAKHLESLTHEMWGTSSKGGSGLLG